jgi:hypothetical protein
MLMNNIAFLFVDEQCLEIFKTSSCNIGIIIGSVKFFIFFIFIEKRKKRHRERNYTDRFRFHNYISKTF